jgi:hypothetical protein
MGHKRGNKWGQIARPLASGSHMSASSGRGMSHPLTSTNVGGENKATSWRARRHAIACLLCPDFEDALRKSMLPFF